MSYVLDANVFIQARNTHYAFDICPGFWTWLDIAGRSGLVLSIDSVADELQDDELADWAKGHRAIFRERDAATLDALSRVFDWITGRRYAPAAIAEFMQDADYFLVAYALAHGHTVVSNEAPAPDSIRRIKIPDVCMGLGVPCIRTHVLLRRERVRFVLDERARGAT